MAQPNKTFELSVDDIGRIESALFAQREAASAKRLALSEDNPAHLDKIRAVDADLRAVRDLLGRLHAQKVFYRPRSGVYVGG